MDPGSKSTTQRIMDLLRAENPSFWPFGLSLKGMDDCWLIRKKASHSPIGFVGWQQIPDPDGKSAGYYSVGILPEFRRQGFGEAAVRHVLARKSASVDRVRAGIVATNGPSIELARKLGVEILHCGEPENPPSFGMVKSAGPAVAKIINALRPYGMPALGALGWDAFINANDYGSVSGPRIGNTLLNTYILAAPRVSNPYKPGTARFQNYLAKARNAAVVSIPVKDVAFAGSMGLMGTLPRVNQALDKLNVPAKSLLDTIKAHPYGAAGVGAGSMALLALLGLGAKRGLDALDNVGQQGSRLKVTLPTRYPGDQETTIEMPFNQVALSNTTIGNVARDIRRRLRAESRSRTGRKRLADQHVVDVADEAAQQATL